MQALESNLLGLGVDRLYQRVLGSNGSEFLALLCEAWDFGALLDGGLLLREGRVVKFLVKRAKVLQLGLLRLVGIEFVCHSSLDKFSHEKTVANTRSRVPRFVRKLVPKPGSARDAASPFG